MADWSSARFSRGRPCWDQLVRIDATNWRAEQAIRPAVVIHKVCGGNRNRKDADTQQMLSTVVRTVRQRRLDLPTLTAGTLRAPEPAIPEVLRASAAARVA